MRSIYALLILSVFLLVGCNFTGNTLPGDITPKQTVPPNEPEVNLSEIPPPSVRPCLADDLEALAGYQGATGSMSGGLSLTNSSATLCALEGRPGMHVTDVEGRLLPVANLPLDNGDVGEGTPRATPKSKKALVLRPGETAFVLFEWSNWCGQAQGPYMLAVALPGEGGQLNVPALSPDGKPLSDTPGCDQTDATSIISIGEFERRR